MKLPPANPLWQRTPPAVSRDGRTVRVDLMHLHDIHEMYRIMGVKPVEPRKPK